MKRWQLLSTVLALSCVATGLQAENRKITFFSQVEYLTYSDAFGKSKDSFNQGVNEDKTDVGGTGEVTSNTKTAGGAGLRIGVF